MSAIFETCSREWVCPFSSPSSVLFLETEVKWLAIHFGKLDNATPLLFPKETHILVPRTYECLLIH